MIANTPKAKTHSARLRSSTTINGIVSNLPYFPRELNASACDAVVQSRLAVNASKMTNTAMGVSRNADLGDSVARTVLLLSKMIAPPTSKRTLAMLMSAIGNPMDAAARQTSISRKLIGFFCKMSGRYGLKIWPHYQ